MVTEIDIVSDEARESGRLSRSRSWFKSTFSADDGCCVEVMIGDEMIQVRDSKYRRLHQNRSNEPVLSYTQAEWKAFVRGVKAGEFDI